MTEPRFDGMSDGELVEQVVAGIRTAYSVLVQRHQDRLLRYALAMLSDPVLAQGLVERVFVDAYAILAECKPCDHFDLWVLGLLRRRFAHSSDPPGSGSVPASLPEIPGSNRTGTAAPRSSTLEEMGQILSQPEEREAFFLRHVEGISYEDIGRIMELSPDAVRERVYRAREGLLIASS